MQRLLCRRPCADDYADAAGWAGGNLVEEGGYHRRGQLRLWDNDFLTGWYAALDGGVRFKGTM